jgi:MbtH protein
MSEESDQRSYMVLINDEEQYSLWVCNRAVPKGWRMVGKEGTKTECCDYIDRVWTDMRPLSLRVHMDELNKNRSFS